jgi:hypothetical protein
MTRAGHVIGRESELATIAHAPSDPTPGCWAVRVEGEAGIGKTTLWRAGVDAARAAGYRVLSARAAQAETGLSYAALGDRRGSYDRQIAVGPAMPACCSISCRSCGAVEAAIAASTEIRPACTSASSDWSNVNIP